MKALLKQKHALSEVKLTHPKLPFLGILDRVQYTGEGVEVVDFKTGKPNDKHRNQLLRYALLWWRKTGDAPVRVSAQYLDGVESWSVTQGAFEDVETDLASDAARPRTKGGRPGIVDLIGAEQTDEAAGRHRLVVERSSNAIPRIVSTHSLPMNYTTVGVKLSPALHAPSPRADRVDLCRSDGALCAVVHG